MFYVIDTVNRYVAHEDKTLEGCCQYVQNVHFMGFRDAGDFLTARNAKERDFVLKNLA